MKEPVKVYNSREGRVGSRRIAIAGNIGVGVNPMISALAFSNRSNQVLTAPAVRGTRDEFKRQELRFLTHYSLPLWRDVKMPDRDELVIAEVRKVCVSVAGYVQTRAHHLLNKGAQIGVTELELKELIAQADCYEEYIKCYNIVIDQGVDNAIRFVQAYPFKQTAIELLEAAHEKL